MNSFYHPREHEHEDDAHSGHPDSQQHAHPAYTERGPGTVGYEEDAVHASHRTHEVHDTTPRPGEEQGREGVEYSGKDGDVYRVLVAVERGELSVEDAARKLEELETASQGEGNAELI